MSLPERIEQKLTRRAGCWEWTACRMNGYGKIYWRGKLQQAHRVVYEIVRGPIPDGLELDHTCYNRGCVNPDHLEAVSHAENIRRGYDQRGRRTACKRGHPYTVGSYYARGEKRDCKTCQRLSVDRRRDAINANELARYHERKLH